MNGAYELSALTLEKLGWYVYLLVDPRDKKIFYVGKGKGGRFVDHLYEKLYESRHEKDEIIKEITRNGLEVEVFLLRHGLDEKTALEIESTIIDFIDYIDISTFIFDSEKLTNRQCGHHADVKGIMTLQEIKIKYEPTDAYIVEPAILININQLYSENMSEEEIYEATRKHWKVDQDRVSKIKIACAVYKGIIREVFIVDSWHSSKHHNYRGRSYFNGQMAPDTIRDKYIHKSVSRYWPQGNQNPIKYINA